MKPALILSIAALVALAACGKADEDNNPSGTNAATNNTSGTTGTTGTNNSVPTAGDCEWGEFIAACGGGPERGISARAVGCTEYYEPSDPADVTEEAVCDGQIWDDMAGCSDGGLSGRRPLGCCFELDADTGLASRHCFYDDPLAVEASAAIAEAACTDAGFCWVPPADMM